MTLHERQYCAKRPDAPLKKEALPVASKTVSPGEDGTEAAVQPATGGPTKKATKLFDITFQRVALLPIPQAPQEADV